MSRLIDADALIKVLKDRATNEAIAGYMTAYDVTNSIIDEVKEQPTAFDTEKIISGLEEEKDIAYADFDKYVNDYELDLDSDYDDLFHIGIERAIDVIRKGGVKYE